MKDVRIEILEKIKEYDSIVIGRHFRPDGDAVGSTMGLGRIISLTFPEKKVYLSNNDKSDYMAFLGDISQSVDEEIIKESLVIVIDTATRDRVSDERILEGKEVIKIESLNSAPIPTVNAEPEWKKLHGKEFFDWYKSHQNCI